MELTVFVKSIFSLSTVYVVIIQIVNRTALLIHQEKAKLQLLREQSYPVTNDWRQQNYSKYISNFASHFGKERCMLVGSTRERTRLRFTRDEGDYDYLLISDVSIPADALEYHADVSCFVHININKVHHEFSNDSVVGGKYLNTSLLKDFDKRVFKILRGLYDVLTLPSLTKSHDSIHIKVNKQVKPGYNQMHYAGFEYRDAQLDYIQVEADIEAITRQFRKLLANSDISVDMISVLSNTLSLIEELRPEDITNSLTFQTFGALIKAASGETISSLYKGRPNPIKEKDTGQTRKDRQISSESQKYLAIRYEYKSGRDFIPAFPITGKLTCLDEWRNRLLKSNVFWPSREIINKIYESEFFVIAKPAIVNAEVNKDFCIGFNNAEMILATSFSDGQRLCFLLLKSLLKGFLKPYSERLTTYLWKSAFYHVSETTQRDQFSDTVGIFSVLRNVIEYMVECLEKLYLRHYFIESNLIAHFSEEESFQVITALKSLLSDPERALDVYFSSKKTAEKIIDYISKEQIEDLKYQEGDLSRTTHAESVVSLISHLQAGTGNNSSKFVEAILDTLSVVVKSELNFDCYKHDFCVEILKMIGDYLNTKFRTKEERKASLGGIALVFSLFQSFT
ncbi:uncharacterized protein LOC133181662 [Saccostrea echinata]|uniref:uncharacterized protein LOC133181662 n=1 Tax=Saccostrea echinata TaxID=191078 RepID=UPI002A81F9DC|nr:uncharacterized protein LOC133181662 [Saccostrea echinata]